MTTATQRCVLIVFLSLLLLTGLPPTAAQEQTEFPQNNTMTSGSMGTTLTGVSSTAASANTGSNSTYTDQSQDSTAHSEADDNYRTAPVIAQNATVSNKIGWKGDIDWYHFNLSDTSDVSVAFQSGSTSNLTVFLYDGGELVDSNYAPPGETVTLQQPAGSTDPHYVAVKGVSNTNDSIGNYQFTLQSVPSQENTDSNTSVPTQNSDSGSLGIGTWVLIILIILLVAAAITLIYRRN